MFSQTVMSHAVWAIVILAGVVPGAVADPADPGLAAGKWIRLDKADVPGRYDVPLIYDPVQKRFLILGGQPTGTADLPYVDGGFDPAAGQWENMFPSGKTWGPKFGPCKPPAFKRRQPFTDVEGNARLDFTYGFTVFWTYRAYGYAPEQKRFIFFSAGYTFAYDPVERTWKDLAPADHPLKSASTPPGSYYGPLLHWGSMCWADDIHRFVLFGGANVPNDRGDPGTWTYDPAANKWEQLSPTTQPAQRANSQLAYDPVNKKVVLFGGDGLNALYSDTWIFDGKQWSAAKPPVSPSPRAGHSLFWHAKSGKIVLLGGYGYGSNFSYGFNGLRDLPLEMWTYDLAANRWDLVRRWDGEQAKQGLPSAGADALRAAVDDNGVIGVLVAERFKGYHFWLGDFDLTKPDADGTAKFGVKEGSPAAVERRTGCYDPASYKDTPAADLAKVEAELKALPANQWVQRKPPKAPAMNLDWGSVVYLPKLDVIARFSGGHCAYSGTAPFVYDIKTDRWSMPFAPELPIQYNCADNGLPGATWTFNGNPWMGSHTYRNTAADPTGGRLVHPRSGYTWFFDPPSGKWTRSAKQYPFQHSEMSTTLCPTPAGLVAWTPPSVLWLMPAGDGEQQWKTMPLKGSLHDMTPDAQGVSFDSRRNRLLMFSNHSKHAGDVAAYDMAAGQATWLDPPGKDKAKVAMRETVYLPELDVVMVGSRVQVADGKWLWLFYDCAKNQWLGAELAGGADPLEVGRKKIGFGNSLGLMYDSARRLVWAVGQHSELHVLRLDSKAAGLAELK